VVQVCEGSLGDPELEALQMYRDQRIHTGELSSHQLGAKPSLVIVVRGKRDLGEGDYLSTVIPANDPLRETFRSLHLIRMPGNFVTHFNDVCKLRTLIVCLTFVVVVCRTLWRSREVAEGLHVPARRRS
jgi:hypothetical protein